MPQQPISNFHFKVDWNGTNLGFSEISGLSIEVSTIEYRDGASLSHVVKKMPGLTKYSNIVLKRGIVNGDNEFYQWLKTAQSNQTERRDVTISLLNEEHEPVMRWKLFNAFAVKIVAPTLIAGASEIAIETLEIAHEGLSIENE